MSAVEEFRVDDLDYAHEVVRSFGPLRGALVASYRSGDEPATIEVCYPLPARLEKVLRRQGRLVPPSVAQHEAGCRVGWRTRPDWLRSRLYNVGWAGLAHIVAEIAAEARR